MPDEIRTYVSGKPRALETEGGESFPVPDTSGGRLKNVFGTGTSGDFTAAYTAPQISEIPVITSVVRPTETVSSVPDSLPPVDQPQRKRLFPPTPSNRPAERAQPASQGEREQVAQYQDAVQGHINWVLNNASGELGRPGITMESLTTADIERLHRVQPIPELAVVKTADAEGVIEISLERTPGSHITLGDVAASYQWFQQLQQIDRHLMGTIRQAVNEGNRIVIRTTYPEKPAQRRQKPRASFRHALFNVLTRPIIPSVPHGEEFPTVR